MSPIPLGILAASGGVAGAYELISTQVLSSSASTVTFSSIPQTFRHLQIRTVVRGTAASEFVEMLMRFNGDSGANYSSHVLRGTGSSVISQVNANSDTRIRFSSFGNSAPSGVFAQKVIDILDYSSSAKNTTSRALVGNNGSSIFRIDLVSGLWMNTASVTSVAFSLGSGDFGSGTRFSIYGLRG
jgi:hypothetical protein